MKNQTLLTVLMLSATLGLASCGKETPSETRADVASAEAAGAKDVAATKEKAAETMASAQNDLTKTQTEVAHEDAAARHSVSLAEAEAAHKTAIERCGADTGDARQLCKKHADAEFELAKARSNLVKAEADPKP